MSEEFNHNNGLGPEGRSNANERARSRRRLLRALGGSGAALGAVLAADWGKPVVKAVMLPAHAQTSVASCSVSVAGAFSISGSGNYSLNVFALHGGTSTALVTAAAGSSSSGSASVAGTVPPGSGYGLGMQVSFGGSSFSLSYAVTAACCHGGSKSFSDSTYASGREVEYDVSVADDGVCNLPDQVPNSQGAVFSF